MPVVVRLILIIFLLALLIIPLTFTVTTIIVSDIRERRAHHKQKQATKLRMMELAEEGFLDWSGGKPKGSDPGIPITPGPPISDYIIEDRR